MAWWKKDVITITMNVVTLSVILSSVIGVSFCYFQIVRRYMQVKSSLKSGINKAFTATAVSSNGIATTVSPTIMVKEENGGFLKRLFPNISKEETKLLVKALAITGTFFALWTPYVILIVVEIATSTPISIGWDQFCCLCAVSNSMINPISMYLFDNRIKENVNYLFLGDKMSL